MAEPSFELKEVIVWIVVAPLAWVWRQVMGIRADLNTHRIKVAEDYVKKDDLKEAMRPLREDLQIIRKKLDSM